MNSLPTPHTSGLCTCLPKLSWLLKFPSFPSSRPPWAHLTAAMAFGVPGGTHCPSRGAHHTASVMLLPLLPHRPRLRQLKEKGCASPQLGPCQGPRETRLPAHSWQRASASYPHGREDDGEVVVVVIQHGLGLLHQPSLAADLGGDLRGAGLGGRTSEPSAQGAVEEEDRAVSGLSSRQGRQGEGPTRVEGLSRACSCPRGRDCPALRLLRGQGRVPVRRTGRNNSTAEQGPQHGLGAAWPSEPLLGVCGHRVPGPRCVELAAAQIRTCMWRVEDRDAYALWSLRPF